MAESGYPLIHNIDISDVVITQMREKYSKYSGLICYHIYINIYMYISYDII